MQRPRTTGLVVVATIMVVMAVVRPASAAPSWEPTVRAELARHLQPHEIERLLKSRWAGTALDELFAGWDGKADSLRVEKTADGVVLHTIIRDRHCRARLQRPESPIEAPICEDTVRADGDRKVTFARDTYTPPKPRPKPQERVADAAVAVEPSRPSVLVGSGTAHNPHPTEKQLDEVAQARLDHADLRDRIRRPGYKDPLLPKDPIEAGDALTPLEWEPIVEEASAYHLKNPFDEARMRTHLPMPHEGITGLGTSLDAPPPIPALRPECTAMWEAKSETGEPPTLDCYRRVAFNERLGDQPLHSALGPFAGILTVPVLSFILEQEVKAATSARTHGPVWAMMWLEWVRAHPGRTADALAKLTPEERRLLRRRLAQWWNEKRLAAWHPTITQLFERHFVALYPESKDMQGLPRKAFLTDTWLWVNNWFAAVEPRDEPAILAAYERLPTAERRLIDAFVREGSLRDKFERAFEVLAGL